MKKFSKKELKEKYGFKKEEADIVIQFQEKLPILTEDTEGFCIDARALHSQLEVGRDFTTWIKGRIKKYNFIENIDYEVFTKSGENLNGGRPSTEYTLTTDMAKELSMIENNENGMAARKYFIHIEKAFNRMIEWNMIREPEKESYKQMTVELDKYFQRNFNKKPCVFDYSNEADSLNLICLGARARQILGYFNAQDKNTREHLLAEYNSYLYEMQKLNIMFLRMNMEKNKRYDMIKQGFKALYPHASYVMANNYQVAN